MKMEPMKSKMKGGIFTVTKKSSFNGRSNGNNHKMNGEELEIRPGGMLVQKRDSNCNTQNSVPVPTIKVRVKYGSSSLQIYISSEASFGELKKMLAEKTGVHHQDQKLIYKRKERDSKAFLDVAGVKDGSKITLIEDITSRQRRCLEMLKSAKVEKASKLLQQITLQVDKLRAKVVALEATNSRGDIVSESDADNLIEMLMNILVELDGIVADGDLKSQKGLQERRVQNYIETLEMLKLQSFRGTTTERNEVTKTPLQKQEDAIEKLSISPLQKQKNVTIQNSEPFFITTKWETFD